MVSVSLPLNIFRQLLNRFPFVQAFLVPSGWILLTFFLPCWDVHMMFLKFLRRYTAGNKQFISWFLMWIYSVVQQKTNLNSPASYWHSHHLCRETQRETFPTITFLLQMHRLWSDLLYFMQTKLCPCFKLVNTSGWHKVTMLIFTTSPLHMQIVCCCGNAIAGDKKIKSLDLVNMLLRRKQ